MARSVAAHQFDPIPAAIEVVCKKTHQRFVSGIVNGRSRYFNFKFLAEGRSDFIGRRAGLQLDREQNAVGLRSKEGRSGHRDMYSLRNKSAATIPAY